MKSHNIVLRPALIKDLSLLQHWDKQAHVIASDPDDDWNWAYELQRFPAWRKQFISELNGRPIGCIQIIDPALEETHYWGNISSGFRAIDIWIGEVNDLNKGYGKIMMDLALTHCFSQANVKTVIIDPLETNLGAIRFYKRIGFQFQERRKFGNHFCMIYRLSKNDWSKTTN